MMQCALASKPQPSSGHAQADASAETGGLITTVAELTKIRPQA
jgi:hypothetical protein